ncbi:vasopressin V2 receptor-like isoform X1 [Sinocyclocheilus rhinocerous]|uniref:vasopressin V2 receptor-like isoform X1 n=2 Tax=Sinocyclocheilus rhinocerous TaxID=307959 RepID=UPI0007BA44ED|nr:PREDICTED: vasopressin V2 receptor-like isoform X1 [Sinocyclocheilus rhinocerous]
MLINRRWIEVMRMASWEENLGQPSHSVLEMEGPPDLSSSLFNLSSSYGGTGAFLWLFPSENITWTTTRPTIQPVAPPQVRDQALAQAEIGVLGLVLALTALGNGFVLWVLLRRKKHHAPMHLFMVNLCVADLVVAFFQVLPQLVWDITEHFQGPDALCRSVKYLQIVGMFASSYVIVAMTVDRHYAICCPLQAYRGGAPSSWNTPIMVAWGLALVLSLPQVFIFSRSEVSPGVFECWGHFAEPWGLKAYVTWMTVAVFVLPAFIITVCQVRIFREIHDNIYLKSERVVTAEFKRNSVFFHFAQREGGRGRSRERNRQSRHSHHADSSLSQAHCSPSYHAGVEASSSSLYDNYSHTLPCRSSICEPCFGPRPSSDSSSPSVQTHLQNTPNHLSDPSHSQSLSANSVCALAGHPNSSGASELWPGVLPDAFPLPTDYSHPPPLPGVTKAMSKTVRMTLVIVLVYTICWSPFFIVQLWAAWDPNPPNQGAAFTILMLLASLNSCTNPWIYTAFSNSVSRELFALLRCHTGSPRRGSLPDDSTTTHTSTNTKDSIY